MTRETTAIRTVLVIDDNQFALDLTKHLLERSAFRVVTRDRPAGSVAAILRDKPDVVLVEVNLPNLSGEAIAKILSRSVPRSNAVILLHSALPVETLRLKAVSSGAHGYVQKTDHHPEFIRRLEQALTKARGTSSARLAAAKAAEEDESAASDRVLPSSGGRSGPEAYLVRPAEQRADRQRAIADPHLPHVRTNRLKVLFVDDDWSLLRAYRSTMGDELDAEFFTSGEEALVRIASNSPPDILVCDIVMPHVTGADLLSRAVLVDPTWAERVIFLTGASSTRVVIDFMNQHEGRVLFKPVPHNRLLDAIHKIGATILTR